MPCAARWCAACCVLLMQTTMMAGEWDSRESLSSEEFFAGMKSEAGGVVDERCSGSPSGSTLSRYGASRKEPWTFQLLPEGPMYRSYLSGGKEPRLASQWVYERDWGWLWDLEAGGRVGLVRYGTSDNEWPEGYQLDLEGAAFPRLVLDNQRDLVSADFRCGVPFTWRSGPWEAKFAYYHLSSHLDDEFMLTHNRIHYGGDLWRLSADIVGLLSANHHRIARGGPLTLQRYSFRYPRIQCNRGDMA